MAREGQPGQLGKAPECTLSWGRRPGREWGVDGFQAKEGVLRFACVKYPSSHRAWIGCSAVGDLGKDTRSPLIGREGPW